MPGQTPPVCSQDPPVPTDIWDDYKTIASTKRVKEMLRQTFCESCNFMLNIMFKLPRSTTPILERMPCKDGNDSSSAHRNAIEAD